MRFSPSAAFLAQANGSAKIIRHRVYLRLTNDLSEGLETGTSWTEVTDRIESVPSIASKIEYDLGQFTCDRITLKGFGVQYFKTNWLDPTETDYTEIKIVSSLAGASDTIYTFCGWIDKKGAKYNELSDMVTFSAFTVDDMMNRFPAEMLSTQYIENSVELNGAGTNGIMCPRIPGLYITNANVTDYVLKEGVHYLSYIYEDSTHKIKLDNGSWTTASEGSQTIENEDGTQKLTVYARSASLGSSTEELMETVIVKTYGETLPYTWYKNISAKYLLKDLYALVGINTVNFDTMEVNTALGGSKISFIDNPPNSTSVSGYKFAIQTDGTDLWLGIGNKLYKKTTSTGEYSLKQSLASGNVIHRIFHNARNGHLWIIHHNRSSSTMYASRYIISSDTLSSAISLGTRSPTYIESDIGTHSMAIFDYNYVSTVWKYGLIFVHPGSGTGDSEVKFLDSADLTVYTLANETTAEYPIIQQIVFVRSNYVYFVIDIGSGSLRIIDFYFDGGDLAWYKGTTYTLTDTFEIGIFNPNNDRIYFWDSEDAKVKTQLYNSDSIADVVTLTGSDVKNFYYGNSLVYFTEQSGQGLYSISGTTATLLYNGVFTRKHSLIYHNSRVMGLDTTGRLWQYYTTIFFFINDAAFEDSDIRSALHQILNAFLFIHKLSAKKEASVYRRCDNSGTPTTSGNELVITINEASDIEEEVLFGEKYDVVEVTNGIVTYKYDGTTWDQEPIGEDVRKFTLDNNLIPSEIVQDICYFAYQFFSIDRHLYRAQLDKITLWQFEPIDKLTLNFTTTNIQKSASGPLYGVTLTPDGGMIVEGIL